MQVTLIVKTKKACMTVKQMEQWVGTIADLYKYHMNQNSHHQDSCVYTWPLHRRL